LPGREQAEEKDFNTEATEELQSSQREEKKRKEAPEDRGLFLFVTRMRRERYQLSLRANWNWRASKAAVGWPAAQVVATRVSQSWFTAEMLV
jgi:hypothetical protein